MATPVLESWQGWSEALPSTCCAGNSNSPCQRPSCALRLENGGILPMNAEQGELWPELRWIKPQTEIVLAPFSHLTAAITAPSPAPAPALAPTPAPAPAVPIDEDDIKVPFDESTLSAEAKAHETVSKKELQLNVRNGDATRWSCPVYECNASYQFKNDLKHHLRKKHPNRDDLARIVAPDKSSKVGKKFPCPHEECTSGFHWQRDLRRHLMMRHGPPENAILMKRKRRPALAVKSEENGQPMEIDEDEQSEASFHSNYESMLLDGSFDHLPQSFI